MAEQYEEVSAVLTNDKVQFTGTSKANPGRPIEFDYYTPIGDGDGYNGLELVLMSLAGCSGTSMAFILRRMGKHVGGLKVQAKGHRTQEPPVKLDQIHLEFVLSSDDATDDDLVKALQLTEEMYCPVWQMVKGNTVIETSYTLTAAALH